MQAKTVRPQVLAIQSRFFEAIEMLIQSGKIKGLQTFCTEYGLHRPKYSNLRNHPEEPKPNTGYKFIDLDALHYLVADFGVSADWLLTGKGGMFRAKKSG